jgi:endonuclease I
MKKTIYLTIFLSFAGINFLLAQPTGYYNGTENKQGDELKAALNNVISGHTVYSYFFSKEIFKLSDADPNTPGNIIEIYTGKSWPNSDYGSGGDQLNREHVWAKSHGNFDGMQPMDGDVHNLKPSDASVNTDKSNLDFDNGGTVHPEATGCKWSDNNWEPRDEDKGDVARIIFYMDTRYEGENGEINLTAVDELNTYPMPEHGKLSTLLEWNLMDPPDEFERNRNNVIYSFQRNRNPFIDNPQFAELIWNSAIPSPVTIANVQQTPAIPVGNQPITISATISSSAGAITGSTLYYGTSWSNLGQTVAMQGSGSNYTANIPGQAQGSTIYFKIEAHDASNSSTTVIYNFYVPKTFTGTLTSIYDIQGQDPVSPYENQVVSVTGIVTGNYGTNYFIQDGSGAWNGLFIYDQGRNPSIGDSIIVTGTIQEYYEKTELGSITDYYFISGGHALPAPAVVTCSQAGEAFEGVLIKVINATCTDEDYMANYYMWNVNDGTGDLLVHNTNVFEYEPSEGEVYNISGPLDYDFDEWKVQIRLGTDVTGGGSDVTAPFVTSLEVINDTLIKLEFNEEVEETSAETIANYSINNGITVVRAYVHGIVKSRVFVVTGFLAGGNHELTIINIGDLVGNIMPAAIVMPFSTSFGVGEDLSGKFSVYPNPTDRIVNIEWGGQQSHPLSYYIYRMTGSKVMSGDLPDDGHGSIRIDVSVLPAGLYIFEMKSEASVERIKLMVR